MTSLQTLRLTMTPLRPPDAAELHSIWMQPGVREFVWDGQGLAPEEVSTILHRNLYLFQTKGLGLWSIRLTGSTDLAGFCGYWYFRDPPKLELTLGLDPGFWGRGLAAEAATAAIRFGFEVGQLSGITTSVEEANTRSHRLLEKVGMKLDRSAVVAGVETRFYRISQTDYVPRHMRYRVLKEKSPL